jgi:phage-related protein
VVLGAGVIALATAFVTAGHMMLSAIKGAMTSVISAVSGGIRNAISAAKAFGSGLVSVGKDLISGLIKGITSMVGSAVKAVGGAVKGIIGKAKSLLHIGSPSKLFKKFGRWTLEGYAIGVQDRASKTAGIMGSTMSDVVAAGSGMAIDGPAIVDPNPGDLLAGGFMRAASAVATVGSALGALPANTQVGVTGDMNTIGTATLTGSGLGGSDAITTVPSNMSAGGTTTATSTDNSSTQRIVNVQPGAINIDAKNMDGRELAQTLEDYLKTVGDKQL